MLLICGVYNVDLGNLVEQLMDVTGDNINFLEEFVLVGLGYSVQCNLRDANAVHDSLTGADMVA